MRKKVLNPKQQAWVDENNRILKYAIAVSKDKCFKSPARMRFGILLNLEKKLKERGAAWQQKVLKIYINKYIKSHLGLTYPDTDDERRQKRKR